MGKLVKRLLDGLKPFVGKHYGLFALNVGSWQLLVTIERNIMVKQ